MPRGACPLFLIARRPPPGNRRIALPKKSFWEMLAMRYFSITLTLCDAAHPYFSGWANAAGAWRREVMGVANAFLGFDRTLLAAWVRLPMRFMRPRTMPNAQPKTGSASETKRRIRRHSCSCGLKPLQHGDLLPCSAVTSTASAQRPRLALASRFCPSGSWLRPSWSGSRTNALHQGPPGW